MVQLREEETTDSVSDTSIDPPSPRPTDTAQTWPFILFSIAVALIATGAYQMSHKPRGCPVNFLYGRSAQSAGGSDEEYSEEIVYGSKKKLKDTYNGRVFTKTELKEHGPGSDKPWVAILGQVYDVSTGKKHYGATGPYSFFTGKDGSKAYSTGDFSDEGLTDDLAGMSVEQIGEIYTWINTFQSKYRHIGRLQGPFFDAIGSPTAKWREIEGSLLKMGEREEIKRALYKQFPGCNSHYNSDEKRGEVWCTEKSGGVTRDWVGYPRKLMIPGEKVRCACVRKAQLSDPKIKEYENCDSSSPSCRFAIP